MTEKPNIKMAVLYWLISVCYMGTIFYLSSRSRFELPDFLMNFDKIVHTCVYVPLAFLFFLSLKKSGIKKYAFLLAFLFATVYGITDEIHQLYVSGREASIGDTAADLIGAFLGSLGASFLKT
jgi:VanZ family protein